MRKIVMYGLVLLCAMPVGAARTTGVKKAGTSHLRQKPIRVETPKVELDFVERAPRTFEFFDAASEVTVVGSTKVGSRSALLSASATQRLDQNQQHTAGLRVGHGGRPKDAGRGETMKASTALERTIAPAMQVQDKLAMLRKLAFNAQQQKLAQQVQTQVAPLLIQDSAIGVLQSLSTPDLQYLLAIPAASVVVCGGTIPAHHLISAKIPNAGQREALRTWVQGGGDWRGAVQQALGARGL